MIVYRNVYGKGDKFAERPPKADNGSTLFHAASTAPALHSYLKALYVVSERLHHACTLEAHRKRRLWRVVYGSLTYHQVLEV